MVCWGIKVPVAAYILSPLSRQEAAAPGRLWLGTRIEGREGRHRQPRLLTDRLIE